MGSGQGDQMMSVETRGADVGRCLLNFTGIICLLHEAQPITPQNQLTLSFGQEWVQEPSQHPWIFRYLACQIINKTEHLMASK